MIKPLSRFVMLEKANVETAVSGSILIPEAYRPDHWYYQVVGVGPKVPPEITVGARVICSPWNGKEFEHEGKSYWLVDFKEVMMTIGVPE